MIVQLWANPVNVGLLMKVKIKELVLYNGKGRVWHDKAIIIIIMLQQFLYTGPIKLPAKSLIEN